MRLASSVPLPSGGLVCGVRRAPRDAVVQERYENVSMTKRAVWRDAATKRTGVARGRPAARALTPPDGVVSRVVPFDALQ